MPTRKAKKYPGRPIVMGIDSAARYLTDSAFRGDLAPWCESKVEVPAIGLPDPVLRPGATAKLPFNMRVACRKCSGCLRHRSRLWAARAADEIKMAHRTWFVTLTVNPTHRFRLSLIAEKRFLRASGELLRNMQQGQQYRMLVWALGRELTTFLKRVRKVNGPFRYLAVFEPHKDGFPHLHLFIHERSQPITKSAIERQWPLGFTQVKLLDDRPGAAFYAAKYLAKEATARVRASQRYGQGLEAFITEQVITICDAVSQKETGQRSLQAMARKRHKAKPFTL